MKSIFVLITFLFTLPLCAQDKKHEISIGIGAPSKPFITDAIRIGTVGIWDNYSYSGTYNASYYYLLNKKRSIGLSYIFEQQKHAYSNSGDPSDKRRSFYTNSYHALILLYSEYWLSRPFINLYSGLGFGVLFCIIKNTLDEHVPYLQPTETKNKLAYQFTPIGIRIGRSFGVYAELGYGYKGILCGGVSYRF